MVTPKQLIIILLLIGAFMLTTAICYVFFEKLDLLKKIILIALNFGWLFILSLYLNKIK